MVLPRLHPSCIPEIPDTPTECNTICHANEWNPDNADANMCRLVMTRSRKDLKQTPKETYTPKQ